MMPVVCRVRDNVHLAFLSSDIDASRVALYDKLKNIEINTSRELVRYIAQESELLIREMNGQNEPILPGYVKTLIDGNCIESTDHRLKVLRETNAGALPGKSLVVFDPELGIAIDVIPSEDSHAQERSLLPQLLNTIEPNDLGVASVNFCVLGFLVKIARLKSFFNIREHKNRPWTPLSELEFVFDDETGKVYEQTVRLVSSGQ